MLNNSMMTMALAAMRLTPKQAKHLVIASLARRIGVRRLSDNAAYASVKDEVAHIRQDKVYKQSMIDVGKKIMEMPVKPVDLSAVTADTIIRGLSEVSPMFAEAYGEFRDTGVFPSEGEWDMSVMVAELVAWLDETPDAGLVVTDLIEDNPFMDLLREVDTALASKESSFLYFDHPNS